MGGAYRNNHTIVSLILVSSYTFFWGFQMKNLFSICASLTLLLGAAAFTFDSGVVTSVSDTEASAVFGGTSSSSSSSTTMSSCPVYYTSDNFPRCNDLHGPGEPPACPEQGCEPTRDVIGNNGHGPYRCVAVSAVCDGCSGNACGQGMYEDGCDSSSSSSSSSTIMI